MPSGSGSGVGEGRPGMSYSIPCPHLPSASSQISITLSPSSVNPRCPSRLMVKGRIENWRFRRLIWTAILVGLSPPWSYQTFPRRRSIPSERDIIVAESHPPMSTSRSFRCQRSFHKKGRSTISARNFPIATLSCCGFAFFHLVFLGYLFFFCLVNFLSSRTKDSIIPTHDPRITTL
ncbi:hypothetical protein M413DRAFT_248206 [Hebeloma cylindrosporum]|uniref:Uncharacterized protein n=1 Tax=Hebeloma cylindrosporum TaxID=76867 RepID=A0A0C2XKE5_HEBCY|nr:hypothetical protein M413DRAFT_248206 [Hebeloma cylindrosporum h7]